VGLSGVSICRRATPSLAVDTTGSWDAYYSRLSSHLSGNVNRHQRKAQRLFGTVRVEQSEPEPGDVEALLTRFAALEATGWKGRGGSALGQQEPLMSFYRRYCGHAAARGELRVATLFFGADIAAMEIAVDAHGRRWQLKIAYQEQVAPFYPGLQLVRGSLRDAFHRQLTSYEFLGVAEAWEEKWQPETREYQKLLIYPPSVYGASALVRDLGVFAWRRAQQARAARTASVWWAGLGVESAVGA
jgi:CelD/BcsL family acetyltransferase involved in cellulose biosynthesis